MQHTVRKTLKGALISAAAGALALTGVGAASAAPAVTATPNTNNQVCGNVYSGAPWVENGNVPAGAEGIEGVKIKGTLYDNTDTVVDVFLTEDRTGSESYHDGYDTDTNGRWCITGTSSMVPVVLGGGYVTLEVVSSPVPITSDNPWESTTETPATHITEDVFLDHVYVTFPPLLSASNFHFTA